MNVLGIKGSPRPGSNSTILLEQILAGANAGGADTTLVVPWELDMQPCIGCGGCYLTGQCVVKDDFQEVYDLIEAADGLVLATPVYFGAVSAQAKVLIDRCESFWSLRYKLGQDLPPSGRPRLGILVVTAGREEDIMYEGPRITFDFWLRACQGEIYGELTEGLLDEKRAVRKNSAIMDQAYAMGRSLAVELESRATHR